MMSSIGTVGDLYANAMAEVVNGAYRTELVWRRKSFRDLGDLELAMFRRISKRLVPRLGRCRRWKPNTIRAKQYKPSL